MLNWLRHTVESSTRIYVPKLMSPITLIIVIALGVAIGISAAPYLGTAVAIAGGALLVAIAALLAFFILRSSVQQGISFVEKIKEGVRIYFRAIPNAWNMLTRPSDVGDGLSLKRRLNGLVALFVCLVWAAVVIGPVLVVIFSG